MTEDLDGWGRTELVSIARWHLMRGFGLSGRDDSWQIEYDRDGVTCAGHSPIDEREIGEGLRLLAHAYPRTEVTVRRRGLTEHDRPWR